MNIVAGQGYPDFCMLTKVEEDEFVKNLKTRFDAKQIYTYIGDQVVSMNPFQSLPIYGKQQMDVYRNRFLYEVQPHVYSLADDTFRHLRQQKKDQCCIITGESGAGKTEAAKIFMSYLAYVSASTGNAEPIKAKLLDSNPVLEAFGNAKTLRNDNSSRFGKYIEIQFDGAAAVQGGQMFQYLLEKSRVVGRANGERSFHIFYDLMAHSKDVGAKLGLQLSGSSADYHYLKLSNCDKIDHVDDGAAFTEVEGAMTRLGFDDASKASTWRILASILHLGNVDFTEGKQANTDSAVVKNHALTKTVAGLLQIGEQALEKALVSRSLSTGADARRSQIQVWLSKPQAELARDTLSKHLYNAVFTWVVNVLNKSVAPKAKSEVVVGVLDIYGFEIFENNSFEQFCINYCNEKLQQLFIQLVLKSEQEEYVKEGIEWKEIPYFNNTPIVELIDKNPGGIFRLLDEACLVGQSTPKSFLEKLSSTFGASHGHYTTFALSQDKSIAHDAFRIKHYAGTVDYYTEQFLEKNRDTLFLDFVNLLGTSANPLIKTLFPAPKVGEKNKRPETAGSQFKLSVELLVKKLKACQPHYIRCVKSNEKKQAFGFNDERVRHQIRYLNLIETVRVRRAGFCNRQPYDRFLPRYKMISSKTWPVFKGSQKDGSRAVVEELKLGKEEYRLGNTKIFIREAPTLQKLEEARAKHMPKVAVMIQRVFRGFKARLYVKRLKSNLYKIRAANSIGNAYIRWVVRRWLKRVIEVFKDARNKPNFGRDLPFPQVGGKMGEKIVRGPQTFFEKLLKKWWGAMKVLSLTPEEQALMRQKCQAYTIFHGKKPWTFNRTFRADYLDSDANPRRATFVKAVQQLFQRGGDSHIWFADDVKKVNRSHKEQLRSLIVTDQHIYKYHPEKYTMRKQPVPIQAVEAIHLSPYKDTYMVIQMESPHRDMLINCVNHGHETYSELTTILCSLVHKLTDKTVPVHFNTSFSYNNRRDEDAGKKQASSGGFSKAKANTDIMLTFEQNPKGGPSTIKNISKTENVILY